MCPQDIMFPVSNHDSSAPNYHILGCVYNHSAPKHYIIGCVHSGGLVCVHNGSAPSILFLPAYTAAVVPASYYWLWPQWQLAQTYFLLLKILQLMCPQYQFCTMWQCEYLLPKGALTHTTILLRLYPISRSQVNASHWSQRVALSRKLSSSHFLSRKLLHIFEHVDSFSHSRSTLAE